MKKFLMAVAAVACMGSVALAGPNAGGTIFVSDANMAYTVDIASYCGLGQAPPSCAGADTVISGANGVPQVFKVYAAFMSGSSPRLKGMTFGIYYDADVRIPGGGFGPCIGDLNNGAAEFQGPGWPGSGTGDAIVWQFTQTTQLVECYWFAGYNYYGHPACFRLGPNPDPGLGGMFSDDAVPPQLDTIAGFGALGFDETCTGTGPRCPTIPPTTGACCINFVCVPDLTQAGCESQGGTYLGDGSTCPNPNCVPPPPVGACCINGQCIDRMTQTDCEGQGGHYYGDGSTCPQPDCPPVPVEQSTWGKIKANYR